MVGDYFKKTDQTLQKFTRWATALITWLRSKTFVLAMLRETQRSNGLEVLAVVRAVITRWTAHYLAFRRLLEIQQALHLMITIDATKPRKESQLITGDKKAKAKARVMVDIMKSSLFWHSLTRYVTRHFS